MRFYFLCSKTILGFIKQGIKRIKFSPFLLRTARPYTTVIFPPTMLSERHTYRSELYIILNCPSIPTVQNSARSSFAPPQRVLTAGPVL